MATTPNNYNNYNSHHAPSPRPQPPTIYFPGQPADSNPDTGPGLTTQAKLELLTCGIESQFGDGLLLTPYVGSTGNARVKIAVDMVGDLDADELDTLDSTKGAIAAMLDQVAARVRGIDGSACNGIESLGDLAAREREKLRWIETLGLPKAEGESCGVGEDCGKWGLLSEQGGWWVDDYDCDVIFESRQEAEDCLDRFKKHDLSVSDLTPSPYPCGDDSSPTDRHA